jgi:methionyl-tRNA formyltransferase
MKRVVFVGNRCNVFNSLLSFPELELVYAYVVQDSYLHKLYPANQAPPVIIGKQDKHSLFETLQHADFDILISNGCPFIIPVSRIKKEHQLFINIHPSNLPHLKGIHPVNGSLLHRHKELGASMHYMDDGIDTGSIIHQESVSITEDLDLGLLYRIAFELESSVFAGGMKKLISSNFTYPGERQTSAGSYYTRSEEEMCVDFATMPDIDIITRVRAFGVQGQGTRCVIGNTVYALFDAEIITNPYLLCRYSDVGCGSLIFEYDSKLLVKSRDGIIKIKSFKKIDPV